MSSATQLQVSELRAGYGGMEVVAGISLEVASGETIALIGRNGAGKTTALLAIAGLRYGRSGGSVRLGDVDLSALSAADIVMHGLALVPEGHRIFRTLTVKENLRIGAYSQRRTGKSNLDSNLQRVLELFPILEKYYNLNAGNLSGGEQQMVAIGQALMAEPKVLMLDEPTSGLAHGIIVLIQEALGRLRDEGLAILIVEQSIKRALTTSHRCYVIDGGKIVLSGASTDLAADERVGQLVRGTSAAS